MIVTVEREKTPATSITFTLTRDEMDNVGRNYGGATQGAGTTMQEIVGAILAAIRS